MSIYAKLKTWDSLPIFIRIRCLNSIMKVGENTRVAPGSVSPLLHLIPWVRTAICPPSPMTNLIYCRQIWGILSFVDCTLSYGFNISPLWPLWAARRGVGWQYDILSLSIIGDPLPLCTRYHAGYADSLTLFLICRGQWIHDIYTQQLHTSCIYCPVSFLCFACMGHFSITF